MPSATMATSEMNPVALFCKALFYPFYCANDECD